MLFSFLSECNCSTLCNRDQAWGTLSPRSHTEAPLGTSDPRPSDDPLPAFWIRSCNQYSLTHVHDNLKRSVVVCRVRYYLRQGGCVFVVVCLFVSDFAQKLRTDLHDIFGEGWQWANEQTVKFWWRSGSGKTEVCIVPVLLVSRLSRQAV